ncbi:hypothetical protein [Streptomyces uncialis]|uniref:hypothetical protein n=1 Tax=Streptomyces uncialis TaxID=1048205 RepID=UPI00224EAC8F|nr:hypothetical protein [Streptomyces uncialis]MCX4659249.1 hypothetical protein [Streptomyces uncialis]
MSQTYLFRHDMAPETGPFTSSRRRDAPAARAGVPRDTGPRRPVPRRAGVRPVAARGRFGRAALIGGGFPRVTPVPTARGEAVDPLRRRTWARGAVPRGTGAGATLRNTGPVPRGPLAPPVGR